MIKISRPFLFILTIICSLLIESLNCFASFEPEEKEGSRSSDHFISDNLVVKY